jgi:hypothetical protein
VTEPAALWAPRFDWSDCLSRRPFIFRYSIYWSMSNDWFIDWCRIHNPFRPAIQPFMFDRSINWSTHQWTEPLCADFRWTIRLFSGTTEIGLNWNAFDSMGLPPKMRTMTMIDLMIPTMSLSWCHCHCHHQPWKCRKVSGFTAQLSLRLIIITDEMSWIEGFDFSDRLRWMWLEPFFPNVLWRPWIDSIQRTYCLSDGP